jgi:hypothetical protein
LKLLKTHLNFLSHPTIQIDELKTEVSELKKANPNAGPYEYTVGGVKTTQWPPVRPAGKKVVLIAGGGGFIGSHLSKRLKGEGEYTVIADWYFILTHPTPIPPHPSLFLPSKSHI